VTGDHAAETTSHRGLLIGLAAGVPIMAYAVRGALVDAHLTQPAELARWIVGLAVIHDLVLVPLVLAIGAAVHRLVPHRALPPVRAALLTSAVLTAVAWPFVRGYGRNPAVPSLLPRNYAWGLLAALAVTWLVASTWLLATTRRQAKLVDHPCGHGGADLAFDERGRDGTEAAGRRGDGAGGGVVRMQPGGARARRGA
jgi:hypothetical protein